MLLDIDRVIANEHLLRHLTGLGLEGFSGLLLTFEEAYRKTKLDLGLSAKKPDIGKINPVDLSSAQKLFFILLHTQHNIARDLTQQLFNISQSDINYLTEGLKRVLESALGEPLPPSKDRVQIGSVAELSQIFPEIEQVITTSPHPKPNKTEQYASKTDAIKEQPAPPTTYTLDEVPPEPQASRVRIPTWVILTLIGLVVPAVSAGGIAAILFEGQWPFSTEQRKTSPVNDSRRVQTSLQPIGL